jgi:hypothetical protein
MLLTLALLGVGLVLRERGFLTGTIPLWEDEAGWAIRLVQLPLQAHDIRPLGFMALSKLLVSLLSPSETVLRALPWIAGIASLAMAPFLADRLFSSAASRLLFVAIIALHPAAIDLSKEFKPYSVGLALHMGLMLLGLRYLSGGRRRDLAPLLGLLFVGTLLSQDALFTYPGMFVLLFLTALRARRKRQLVAIGLTAVMTLGLLLGLYFAFWRSCLGQDTTDYWGKKYHVFYVPNDEPSISRAHWTADRLLELAALPGMDRAHWQTHQLSESRLEELQEIDTTVWEVLGVLGAATLLRRRRREEQLLLLGPLAVLVAFNAFGAWPLGVFRTNLFALLYVSAIVAAAFERSGSALERWDFVPALALVIAPFLLLGDTKHSTKWALAGDSAFPKALHALSALRVRGQEHAPLVLDSASCSPYRYYIHYHPRHSRLRELQEDFHAQCSRDVGHMLHIVRKGLTSPESRAFAVFSRSRWRDELEQRLPPELQVDVENVIGDHIVLRMKLRSDG